VPNQKEFKSRRKNVENQPIYRQLSPIDTDSTRKNCVITLTTHCGAQATLCAANAAVPRMNTGGTRIESVFDPC
jgi:hypothetical protein